MKKRMIKISTISIITYFSLIGLALAASGTGGSAGGSKGMTWQEIKVSQFFKAEFPVYEIEDYNVSYDKLCLTPNDYVRTKSQFLVGWKMTDESYIYQYDYLSRPREITKRVCVDLNNTGQCVWEELVDEIPTEQTIQIHRYDEGRWQLDSSRVYELDVCENIRHTIII